MMVSDLMQKYTLKEIEMLMVYYNVKSEEIKSATGSKHGRIKPTNPETELILLAKTMEKNAPLSVRLSPEENKFMRERIAKAKEKRG